MRATRPLTDAVRHLDKRFASLRALAANPPPPKGWLRAIREALGMTTDQFAHRLGVSQPRIVELEQSEASGRVTLNTLQRAAEALGCRVVYALVPERPLTETVHNRARVVAARRLESVAHTMRLEDQSVKDDVAKRALEREAVEDLLRNPRRLWDDM